MDETLIHYDERKNNLLIRPHLHYFLSKLKQDFNLVLFTAGLQEYAEIIIQYLDPEEEFFCQKYYRKHLIEMENQVYQKNLNMVCPDLSRILILDNNPVNFSKQTKNGIWVKSWYGDSKDDSLLRLVPLLTNMLTCGVEDVREYFCDQKIKEKFGYSNDRPF